ncbi:MAG: hypothetical protein RIT81_38765 [Deltaproteobacteria bacterium]
MKKLFISVAAFFAVCGSAEVFAKPPTCKAFTTHVVTIMERDMKDDSMFSKSDIPELVKLCRKVGNLPKHPKTVACAMAAKDAKALFGCRPKVNKVMGPWLKAGR